MQLRFVWILLSFTLAGAPAQATVVDRVVAAVGEQLVTDSELRLESELAPLDVESGPFWSSTRAEPLQRLIDAALIRELAGEVQVYLPAELDIAARVEGMRARFESREAWEAFLRIHGLDEEGIRAVMRRRMVVERYLVRNIPIRTTETAAFNAATETLLSTQRGRYRIRIIAPETP